MSGFDLLAEADALYGGPLDSFTARRDARARELKADAEPAASAAVKALRKPTLAAWVVDLLVRVDSEQIAQVLELGAALREAQESMAGEQLRELTRQRRQLTAALAGRARAAAATEGLRLTDAVREQVEGTLTAAMLDPECARAVRSGLLVAALTSTGVGESAAGAAVALPEALGFTAPARAAPAPRPEPPAPPSLRVVEDPDAAARALEAARAEAAEALADAEARLADAEAAAGEADAEHERLSARALELHSRLEELRRQVAEVEEESEQVEEALDGAAEVLEDHRAEVADARGSVEEARAALAELG